MMLRDSQSRQLPPHIFSAKLKTAAAKKLTMIIASPHLHSVAAIANTIPISTCIHTVSVSQQDNTMTDVAKPVADVDVTEKEVVKKSSALVYQAPFVEKYRPRVLEDVVGNEETLLRLRAIAVDGNVPNLILCGPPGTGKTTSVHALARQLLGSSYKDAVLELNASDARGIDVSSIYCDCIL
jgi:Cdc6-like AAA superfamily ATPase